MLQNSVGLHQQLVKILQSEAIHMFIMPLRHRLIDAPADIKVIIMSSLDNVNTLQACLRADQSVSLLFETSFNTIMPKVLANVRPRDTQQLTCLLISLRDTLPFQDHDLGSVLETSVSSDSKAKDLSIDENSSQAIGDFTSYCTTHEGCKVFYEIVSPPFARRHEDFANCALDSAKTHQLKRAPWRLEVCYAPADADLIQSS